MLPSPRPPQLGSFEMKNGEWFLYILYVYINILYVYINILYVYINILYVYINILYVYINILYVYVFMSSSEKSNLAMGNSRELEHHL